VAELRRRYDPQYVAAAGSQKDSNRSLDSSVRSLPKPPSVSDVMEDEEDEPVAPMAPSELNYDPRQRSSSRASRRSTHSRDRLHHQEESMRQHLAQIHNYHPQQAYHPDLDHNPQPPNPDASSHPEQPQYAHPMAMQPYQWPSPPTGVSIPDPQTVAGHADRPPVPDAPDLTKRTVAGYEKLALELSNPDSPVKPLYRKFEFLNHRLLLHLQDEISELEERLRIMDEVLAQMDPLHPDGGATPASRRAETYYGSDLHRQRVHLLGEIFLKTEQYSRAMAAFTAMGANSRPAKPEQVAAYRGWMAEHAPLHEFETRFLLHPGDLVCPGEKKRSAAEMEAEATAVAAQTPHNVAVAYLPLFLMLPLLLFGVVPTFTGRLGITLSVVLCASGFVATTNHVRLLLLPRDWCLCGAAYLVFMAAVAGCAA
jgi:hypothetical protein